MPYGGRGRWQVHDRARLTGLAWDMTAGPGIRASGAAPAPISDKELAGNMPGPNKLEEEYEVEAIMGEKNGKFLIKWKGCAESEATWERAALCTGCPRLIDSFRKAELQKKACRARH